MIYVKVESTNVIDVPALRHLGEKKKKEHFHWV